MARTPDDLFLSHVDTMLSHVSRYCACDTNVCVRYALASASFFQQRGNFIIIMTIMMIVALSRVIVCETYHLQEERRWMRLHSLAPSYPCFRQTAVTKPCSQV